MNNMYASVVFTVAMLLVAGGPAMAFNPQPEPPANTWRVEGYIDMTALEIIATTDSAKPFGVDAAIIGDGDVDFRAAIIAMFTAADNDGDLKPEDGLYTATIRFFDVFIGNTHWDETIPSQDLELQVQGGVVTGLHGYLTDTMPAHPDLHFMFPASPGTWKVFDERNGINLGTISGSYRLRDGVVAERKGSPWYLFLPAFIEKLKSTDDGD